MIDRNDLIRELVKDKEKVELTRKSLNKNNVKIKLYNLKFNN